MHSPERSRRAGSRRDALPAAVRSAIRAEATRLRKVDDPVAVITSVGDAFAAVADELAELGEMRLRAVQRLRADGWSYARIAEATGLSRGRVQQLSNAAKSGSG